MAIEKSRRKSISRETSLPARIVIGALALFGAIMLAQWVLATVLNVIKFGLLVVVVLGIAAWVVSAKGNR